MFFYFLIALCICIDDPKLVCLSPLPTALQHGIAKDSTSDIYSYRQIISTIQMVLSAKYVSARRFLKLLQDGSKLQCSLCTRSALHRHAKSIPVSLFS